MRLDQDKFTLTQLIPRHIPMLLGMIFVFAFNLAAVSTVNGAEHKVQDASLLPSSDSNFDCPVTIPLENAQRREKEKYGTNHRNKFLGIQLNGAGAVRFAQEDFEKFGYIWQKYHVMTYHRGIMKVTGSRLDLENGPPLRSTPSIRSNNDGFVPFGLYFPTTGCWEVTLHLVSEDNHADIISGSELTFVTRAELIESANK